MIDKDDYKGRKEKMMNKRNVYSKINENKMKLGRGIEKFVNPMTFKDLFSFLPQTLSSFSSSSLR